MNTTEPTRARTMTNLHEGVDGNVDTLETKADSKPESKPSRAGKIKKDVAALEAKLPNMDGVKESIDSVSATLRDLPALIESETREHPYRALGVAAGVGFGVGAVMSSRILRLMLVTAGGYAVNELARGKIKAFIDEIQAKAEEA